MIKGIVVTALVLDHGCEKIRVMRSVGDAMERWFLSRQRRAGDGGHA